MPPDYEYIPGRFGYWLERTGAGSVAGRISLLPSTTDADGTMRTAAVLMAIDMTCGMAAGIAVLPKWTVTADADVHFFEPCRIGLLRVDATGVRAGRTMSIVEARVVDEGNGDTLVALVTANHGVLESSFDHFLADAAIGDIQRFARPDHPDDESIEDYFGLAADGDSVRIPLVSRSTNPWGILHGGLHGLLVDIAATGAGLVAIDDVMLRFLNPVRTGPAIATVTDDRSRADNRVLRVEVRDGDDGRLALLGHVIGRGTVP
jgi:acyl-coenzyme A thioesterase PaaI-like protein